MKRILIIVSCIVALSSGRGYAQSIGLKTNLLYWATTTPNATLDWRMADQWTGSITTGYNPWKFPSYEREEGMVHPKLMHWLVMPEVKWWPCKAWERHAWGLHALYGNYNVGGIRFIKALRDYRYEGWMAGAGLSWTYHWVIGNRWGLEASLGVGYVYFKYGKYDCVECSDKVGDFTRHYYGPTKAALSLILFIN